MLDLKAKLLQAGLVTEEQVSQVESAEAAERERRAAARQGKKQKGGGGGKPKGTASPASEQERWERRVAELREAPKSDQYDAIRGWVQRTRLDQAKGLPSENADRFHFTKHDGHISWLTLEPDLKQQLSEGKAGIIAFMSHNGLAHCVVPKDVAADVGKVKPEWVRHLDGFPVQTNVPGAEPEPATEATAAEGPAAEGSDDDATRSGSSAASPPPEET